MKPLGSVAAVVAAIRGDGAAEAEAVDLQAKEEIERIRVLESSDIVAIADRESRLSAARQQAQARLAHEDWEDTREAVADREQWLARVVQLGERLLANSNDDEIRERLAVLAREGLVRLAGRSCEVVVSENVVGLLDAAWQRSVADAAGLTEVRVRGGPVDGGCVVRTLDGRASFDNSYAARARRFPAAWRSALADVYEQAISTAVSSGARPSAG